MAHNSIRGNESSLKLHVLSRKQFKYELYDKTKYMVMSRDHNAGRIEI